MSINIEELTSRKTSETFPNIVITKPNENIPVVVRSLEEGDMQLIIEYKGKRKVVARISPSALNVDKLLRTAGSITYHKDENQHFEITDVSMYLGCLV